DSVVLADFANSTSDPVFNDALNTALRVELDQTPFLNLLAPDKVRGTLKLLNHPENEKLTPELAREVCLRTNSKAVIAGSIADVGNRYHIALKGLDCQTGKLLAETNRETAAATTLLRLWGSPAASSARSWANRRLHCKGSTSLWSWPQVLPPRPYKPTPSVWIREAKGALPMRCLTSSTQ